MPSTARPGVQRLGRLGPAATFDAVLTGFVLCGHRWNGQTSGDTDVHHQWARRADLLTPRGTENETFTKSRLFAAVYPEAVRIAEIIGSLHWRRLAAGGPDDRRRFTAELTRRLGLADYRPLCVDDPVSHWIDQRSWQPPALPHSTFRAERTFAGPTFRKPADKSESARQHSATWFTTTRRGAMLLQHRALTPVNPRKFVTSDMAKQLRDVSHLTVAQINALLLSEYLRPNPAEDLIYLDTATEPAPWADQDTPRPSRAGQPWFPGS
jgi:hypothetical protein